MLRAICNGTVLAETSRTVLLEGSHYFPPDSIHEEYFTKSKAKTLCPWKGFASYYNVTTEGGTLRNVAWYYPHPTPLARRIKNHIAFYENIIIIEGADDSFRPSA